MTFDRPVRSILSRLLLVGACAGFLIGLPVSALSAEFPPGKLENLMMFPRDIEVKQLLDAMKSFSKALGVRCWHCHVGQEGQDLSEFDFISDTKAEKQIARTMMRMTRAIRQDTMPEVARIMREIGGHDNADPAVNCYTCHRGKTHPGDD